MHTAETLKIWTTSPSKQSDVHIEPTSNLEIWFCVPQVANRCNRYMYGWNSHSCQSAKLYLFHLRRATWINPDVFQERGFPCLWSLISFIWYRYRLWWTSESPGLHTSWEWIKICLNTMCYNVFGLLYHVTKCLGWHVPGDTQMGLMSAGAPTLYFQVTQMLKPARRKALLLQIRGRRMNNSSPYYANVLILSYYPLKACKQAWIDHSFKSRSNPRQMRRNCFVSRFHVAHVKIWKLQRLSTVFSEVNLHYKRRSFFSERRLWREKSHCRCRARLHN